LLHAPFTVTTWAFVEQRFDHAVRVVSAPCLVEPQFNLADRIFICLGHDDFPVSSRSMLCSPEIDHQLEQGPWIVPNRYRQSASKSRSELQALPIELAIAQEVRFSQHSLSIDDDVRTNRYSNASLAFARESRAITCVVCYNRHVNGIEESQAS